MKADLATAKGSSPAFSAPRTYRARLLSRCLNKCFNTVLVSGGAAESRFRGGATVGKAGAHDARGVGDLVDFLQQEATPYEVNVPPYLILPPLKSNEATTHRRAGDSGGQGPAAAGGRGQARHGRRQAAASAATTVSAAPQTGATKPAATAKTTPQRPRGSDADAGSRAQSQYGFGDPPGGGALKGAVDAASDAAPDVAAASPAPAGISDQLSTPACPPEREPQAGKPRASGRAPAAPGVGPQDVGGGSGACAPAPDESHMGLTHRDQGHDERISQTAGEAWKAGAVAAPPAAPTPSPPGLAAAPTRLASSALGTHSSDGDMRRAVPGRDTPSLSAVAGPVTLSGSSSSSSGRNSSSNSNTSTSSTSNGVTITSNVGVNGASPQERLMAARRAVVTMQWNTHLGRRGRSFAPLPTGGMSIATSAASSSTSSASSSSSMNDGSNAKKTSDAAVSLPVGQQPAAEQPHVPTAPGGPSQTGASAVAAQAPSSAMPTAAMAATMGSATIGSAATLPTAAVVSSAAAEGTQPSGLLLAGGRPALLGRTIQGRIARLQAAREALRAARHARVGAAMQPPPVQARPVQGQSGQVPQVGQGPVQSQPGRRQEPAASATKLHVADGLPARPVQPAVSATDLQTDTATAASAPFPVSDASLGSTEPLAASAPTTSLASASGPAIGTSSSNAHSSAAASEAAAGTVRAPTDTAAPAASPAATAPALASTPFATPAAAPLPEPPEVVAARDLLGRLSRYQPAGRDDGPAVLAPHARYSPAAYQAAAAAAAAQPQLLLAPLSLPQLAAVVAGYAAAGHRHEPLLEALAGVALAKAGGAGGIGGGAAGAVPRGQAASELKRSRLTFRAACVFLTALARLGYRGGAVTRLAAALAVWLARQLNTGAVTPRAKWKGTWLAAALWAYATLEQLPAAAPTPPPPPASAAAASTAPRAAESRPAAAPAPAEATATRTPLLTAPQLAPQRASASPDLELARGGVLLFTEAAEAVRVAPGWLHLMDGREALWSLWAFRKAAAAYGRGEGTASGAVYVAAAGGYAMLQSGGAGGGGMGQAGGAGRGGAGAGAAALPLVVAAPRYEANPLVELKLADRATSLFPQLDPGQLAEAHVLLLECGLAEDELPQALTALRRCVIARADSIRPQPLAVMVATLAVMQVRDVVWLSALAMACRNKMINMSPDQIVAVLHAFGSVLRFHHLLLFHAAAVVCSCPGMWRLGGMGAGEVLRLVGAFAATRHYEGRLLRAAAERMLQLGSTGSTAGQRAGLLQSLCSLHYRHNGLLRIVVADTFGLADLSPGSAGQPRNMGSSAKLAGAGTAAAAGAAAPGLPPSLLVAVAEACGQLQHRPPGLLQALHASRAAVWPRVGLAQRATLCWALLVLTGGLPAQYLPADRPRDAKRHVRQSAAAAAAAAAAAQDQRQEQHQQHQQEQLLAKALVEYLQALGAGVQRWPPPAPSSYHLQLLVACTVLASCTPPPAPAHMQQQPQSSGTGCQKSRRRRMRYRRSRGAVLQQQLKEELDKLPASAMQRALEVQRRARSAALGGWAHEVASVVREVLQEASVDARADSEGRQPLPPHWLGQPPATLLSAAVSTGVEVCDGAMLVDVAVELEVEAGLPRPQVKGRGRGRRTAARATTDVQGAEQAVVTEEAAYEHSHPLRQRLQLALDLCPLPPPPPRTAAPVLSAAYAPGAGGAGTSATAEVTANRTTGAPRSLAVGAAAGGAVIRNSRWLLSGAGALRRRLLTHAGWLVVPVRERQWKDLRSAEQQRRVVREWLKAVLLHAQQ
uniref:Trans-splicing factor Raa3, chloroplastic n=1 Tax=Chlamydomonas reinhardtii TaxID=3055 RepID=RAA3_CHLRE|nr:RecName: Full=Trans-splicing factor Raa3, chloroplastic; Flags: Precursor [Chlamydomonas reinhardtii]AAG39999.1 trans-splicing factor Raa3 [Chlamydomonas reinhardtii]AAG40000.1 trans-splicing factor Raa3 [Chlamydomonas reinhardtii]